MLLPIQITSIVQAIAGKTDGNREVLGTKLRLFRQSRRKWRKILHVLQSRYCQTFALKTWQEQQKYCLTRDK